MEAFQNQPKNSVTGNVARTVQDFENGEPSGQSSQVNRKRSFLDIVNNPLEAKTQPEKILKDSPLSINSLLWDSGQSTPPNRSLITPPLYINHMDQSYEGEPPVAEIPKKTEPITMNGALPPMTVARISSTENGNSKQSLPSLVSLFGANFCQNRPTSNIRYPSPAFQRHRESPVQANPLATPLATPNRSDIYTIQRNGQRSIPGYSHAVTALAPKSPNFQDPNLGLARASMEPTPSLGSSSVRFPLSDRLNSACGNDNRFVLLEQPNEIQRKSYKNESRYLLPNPLTICLRNNPDKDLPPILDGTVSAKIVDSDGNDLPPQLQNILESLGGLVRPLDEEKSAGFSLKVSATSVGSMYRLIFTVNYRVKGNPATQTETIISTPFSVCSNRKKQLKELKERLNSLQKK